MQVTSRELPAWHPLHPAPHIRCPAPEKHSLVEEGEEITQNHQHRSRHQGQEAAHKLHPVFHGLQLCAKAIAQERRL